MDEEVMTIREMCEAFGVTPRTLRFYEAKELLSPIRDGQKRLFTRRDRGRLKLILRGKRFGFSLEEIRELLELYSIGDQQHTQYKETYELAMRRLAEMEKQRDELTETIDELKAQIDWGGKLIASIETEKKAAESAPEESQDMPSYTAPTKDAQFILHDVLKVSEADIPGYDELEPDFTNAILEEAGKIASEVLQPLNAVGDTQGCVLENGVVRTPEGFKAAFEQVKEGGWPGLDMPEAFGGQNMPVVIGSVVGEFFSSANQAFTMYQGLTHGAASAILAHGSEDQKATYLPNMVSCEWTGTMNLTEPHCGTDLGLMRTKAEPQGDGTYRVTGQKIFISAGEHDMAENIIHLVLAKIPGGPEGIKGVSLFIVPKFLVNEDGSLGNRNGVSCGKIEEKMGIHGNSTCVMNYDGATGYLLGEEHKGMRAMFTMMNEARLGVGMQGLAQAEVAFQNARDYAIDRLQGRDVTGVKNPEGPADPLIVHPDVRRALMDQKSFAEGARAFILWGATLLDAAHRSGDKDADGLISLLTPVIKGFLTDEGYDMTIRAQQLYGGHGYIEEWGMSQFTRDARIAMIYEGANGVQALDLVGRKLGADGGKHVMAFFALVKDFIAEHKGQDAEFDRDFLEPLKAGSKALQDAAMYFMQEGMKNPNNALAGSSDFMHLFGHVCLGLMWARMGRAAQVALAGGASDVAFYETKLATGRYYMARRLPAAQMHLARITSGAEPVMALEAANF